jgi:hypothetical protein
MRTRFTPILLLVVLLSAPLVAAYGFRGDVEPSTKRDTTDGYMWTTPSTV